LDDHIDLLSVMQKVLVSVPGTTCDVDLSPIWLPGVCMKRMHEIYDLQMLIVIAIILTGGRPARAVEYAMLVLSNIVGGSIWNAFWLFNTFVL
jgi:hypothetical protein